MFRASSMNWTSKRGGNFLLQHETCEMGHVVTQNAVIQIRGWTRKQINPDLIACFQVQRRLERHRTNLINGDVILYNMSRPDWISVQIKIRIKISISRWLYKTSRSREREKINSRSWGREYTRCQIHGISFIHPCKIKRNRSWCFVKIRISLDVEMDRRRFNVDISNPFLETFSSIIELDNCNWIIREYLKHLPASPGSLVKSQ